jgi:CubicO group peptidase (beta-lactamase class C family)
MSPSRQSRVEHGLLAALQIAGRPAATFSLVDRMQRYGVPGVSIAVVDDGEVAWAAGYGTAQATTLFQAASISKAVAAVAVLALVEAGDLDLDADVNRFLRSWQLPPSEHTAAQPVTLRHLLSHTAGTTVPGFPGYAVGSPVPATVDVLRGAAGAKTPAVESFARPGTVAQYSGGGSTVVQQMLVDVTGRSFEALVDDLVLRPFGMIDSGYEQPLPAHRQHRAAVGHGASGAPVPGGFHVYPELQAAGLWTTAIDLARWIVGVQRVLGGWRGGPISPEMAKLMVTPVGLGPFGLGPELGGEGGLRRFGHSGANEGFRSQMDGLVERPVGGVVLTNADNGTTLCAEVRKAFAAEYGWGELGAPPISLADVPAEVLRSYAGRYRGPFGRPMRLEFDGGELFSPAPYGRRHMLPLGPTTFLDEETGATLEVEHADGAVSRIAVLVDGAELMAFEPEGSE